MRYALALVLSLALAACGPTPRTPIPDPPLEDAGSTCVAWSGARPDPSICWQGGYPTWSACERVWRCL